MKHLKYILPLMMLFALAGCKKSGDANLVTAPIDTDLFVHHITFAAPTQFSAGKITSNTITIVYNENVNILVPKLGYELSYALHLKEDFSSTVLKSFSYITVDKQGNITTNWVDDNLNNVSGKTIRDTTVAGIAMVNVNVQRPFTFTKTYANNASAVSALDSIAKLQTDKIIFSSYLYFTKTYPATLTNSNVFYAK
jgi:hypothetical protein